MTLTVRYTDTANNTTTNNNNNNRKQNNNMLIASFQANLLTHCVCDKKTFVLNILNWTLEQTIDFVNNNINS